MGLPPLEIFSFFQRGDGLHTSESDVYRRQILTYIDGPRTVNPYPTAKHDYSRLYYVLFAN